MQVSPETMVASLRQFLDAYKQVHDMRAAPIYPRGSACWEVENFMGEFSSLYPITSFHARKLNLQYAAREFLWYLRGDRFDTSIEAHASMWKKIRTEDGGFNSNYGQYLRGPHGLDWAMESLRNDADSRQACIVLLKADHLKAGNPDIVCTYSISFRIRNGKLNMSVNMRSNDAIFGLTNDVFCFGLIHQMALGLLHVRYPELRLGTYTHKVDSFHIYQQHFELTETILSDREGQCYYINMPVMDPAAATILWNFEWSEDIRDVDADIKKLSVIWKNEFVGTICRWAMYGPNDDDIFG